MKFLVVFIGLIGGIVSFTQAQQLRGTTKDGISGQLLAEVIITNERTHQQTRSNQLGTFSLPVEHGDPISFVLSGYKPQQYHVPKGQGDAEMHISLFQMSYDLDEFTFRNKFTRYQMDSIERRSTYARALSRQKGGSILSPVSFIAEKLSQKSKRTFQFQKDFKQWEEEKFIASIYTPELVNSQTKLQGDSLAHFMNSHPMPYDFARGASDLEIKVWIREQFNLWNRSTFDTITDP
ncbi:MAG TPA: hypothetical protein PLQ78_00895 [Flavipsychrobacter sp.]|nr:hypothetical protein [Flavipsychrobacter sp.]